MFGPSEGEEKPLWGGHRQWDSHFSLHLHWIFCLVSHDWMTAQWLAPIYDDQHWQTYTYTSEGPTCYWKTGKTKYIFPCGCPYYDSLLILLELTELKERGAAGLQPGLPHRLLCSQLALHRLHRPLMSLSGLLHHSEDGVKGRLGVRGQRRGLRWVPREIVEQRRIVVGHIPRRAEADLCVHADGLVLWAEVWCEVKGFPHWATWRKRKKNHRITSERLFSRRCSSCRYAINRISAYCHLYSNHSWKRHTVNEVCFYHLKR